MGLKLRDLWVYKFKNLQEQICKRVTVDNHDK